MNSKAVRKGLSVQPRPLGPWVPAPAPPSRRAAPASEGRSRWVESSNEHSSPAPPIPHAVSALAPPIPRARPGFQGTGRGRDQRGARLRSRPRGSGLRLPRGPAYPLSLSVFWAARDAAPRCALWPGCCRCWARQAQWAPGSVLAPPGSWAPPPPAPRRPCSCRCSGRDQKSGS